MAWQHGPLHQGFMALSQSQSTNNINQTNSRQRWFFLPKLLLLIVLINEVRPEIVILARLYSVLTPGHWDCGTTGCRNGAEVLCNIYTKCQWTPRITIGSWGGGGRRWTKISGKITKSNHNSLIILGFWLPMGNSLENASLVIPWCHLIPHNPSYECSGHRDTGKYMVKQATAFSFKDSVCSFRSEILDISVHLHVEYTDKPAVLRPKISW